MNLRYETQKIKQGYDYIIGCDEVGRGCLAGPVVAAAVILDLRLKIDDLREIKDSKLVSAEKRQQLDPIIKEHALAWSIAETSSKQVDAINIHNASLLAMKKAVEKLFVPSIPQWRSKALSHRDMRDPDTSLSSETRLSDALGRDDKQLFLAADGKFKIPNLQIDQEAVINGDNKILSIAAASIIAKVYRDNLMVKLHKVYPIYNFARHKGYATLYHRQMIIQNGLSPLHRLSFCHNLKAS